MTPYSFEPGCNFLGLPEASNAADRSGVVVLPVPYELSTSYRSGTRYGPTAILDASRQIELYDREFDDEPALRWGVHTLPPLARNLESPEAAAETVAAAVEDLARTGKLVVILGGEHSISIGVAQGLHRALGEFITVQFDAHADLRESYEGTRYSHACTARRLSEISRVVQIGVRSLDISEARFLRECGDRVVTFYAEDVIANLQSVAGRVRELVCGQPVFLTLDVDVLDPSLMPSTGTPEPGGLSWEHVTALVRTISKAGNILAFDCVELAPTPSLHAPDYLAARLVYKTMCHAMARRNC